MCFTILLFIAVYYLLMNQVNLTYEVRHDEKGDNIA